MALHALALFLSLSLLNFGRLLDFRVWDYDQVDPIRPTVDTGGNHPGLRLQSVVLLRSEPVRPRVTPFYKMNGSKLPTPQNG